MSTEEQLEKIEISIEEATKSVDLFNSLQRLNTNPDFKKVMLDGYFSEECVRLVLLKADHEMRDEDRQNQIIKSIDAIGHTRTYLRTIMQLGQMAARSLEADKGTREDLRNEQA